MNEKGLRYPNFNLSDNVTNVIAEYLMKNCYLTELY